MCDLIIFGGTSEGRMLAEYCAEKHIHAYISVTTEYGSELIEKSEYLNILKGTMNSVNILNFIASHNIKTVIDATHPYAQEITQNIKSICDHLPVYYFRIVRPENPAVRIGKYFENVEDMISFLNSTTGNILITTGSKNLRYFCSIKNYTKRCTVRVLPSEDITGQCCEMGFDRNKIISEKGPFTEEQNIQHIQESGALFLVTKDSGNTGGFTEKIRAAEKCGIVPLMLKRPKEKGILLEEMKKILTEEYCE